MKDVQVQVKVIEGIEVRAHEKGEFMIGALITNNGKEVGASGIVAGVPEDITNFYAAIEAMAGSVTKTLLDAEVPPQVIEGMMIEAIRDGIKEGVTRHVAEEMPHVHAMAERAMQGDIGALLGMLSKVLA
ncbi:MULTISPECIES: hypothetical protein [unclassified Paenibacillus]|uniref:hypothetical protein n=1 Tax=unclassified Paenibacillus TaxID=185978 RepID=UPI0008955D35|nr:MULTISPECIES: hypothetical protein [unclassified Paenibacillus]OMC68678.1 hypothetical protein BK126_12750 [Paenibacillus sp. FSL H7-0326]SDW55218.1 hypothetical protein SAMN05518848_102140 [Paenibacillus sp. PDC88]